VVDGADHSLETTGDIPASVWAMERLLAAQQTFLAN